MLQSLKIQNYALIENLEIDFNKGFSTITGETGAGKSLPLSDPMTGRLGKLCIVRIFFGIGPGD